MKFNGEKAAFGRHETFALRFGWLTKGAQALMSGDPVFEAEDATVRLGVGKNMVSSIRYWLQAARIIERGQSKDYHHAVGWLERARAAYRAAGQEGEWQAYIAEVRTRHGRKYKLMRMIEGM